jgi:hypothetical protein
MALAMSSDPGAGQPVRSWSQKLRPVMVLAMVAVLGVLGGGLSASGKPQLIAVFFGLVIVALIVSSRVALFWFVVISALVVTGLCQLYLPLLKYVRYVVPMASVPLLLHGVVDYFTTWTRTKDEPMPAIMMWALAFAVSCIVSVLISLSDPAVALVGLKGYFQMWGLFLSVVYLRWNDRFTKNLAWGLFLIALLQLPFVAHEYLVLVPKRVGLGGGIVPVDIVAGTFGAILEAGGANAVLAAYQCIVVACLLALWKNGALGGFKAAVISLALLSPMVVNQAKITALYVPLVFIVVFYRDIAVRPLKFIVAGASTVGLLVILMTALVLGSNSSKIKDSADLVNFVIAQQTASADQRVGQYSELSRWTALTFWAQEHVRLNPINTLLGHGVGSSRENAGGLDVTDTLAEKHYAGLRIGYTALSALLWDTGLLGLITVLGMFTSAFFTAGQLASHYRGKDNFRTGLFEGLQAGMAVLTLSLAHKDFFINHLPYQAFTYLIIGFIAYSWLEVVRSEGQGRRI